MAEIQFQDMSN